MSSFASIPVSRYPRHIAIIMDGNGRWATKRGKPRVVGHRQGVVTVQNIVTACSNLCRDSGAPTHLTLYSFSLENWKRPAEEVAYLMEMLVEYLKIELPTMVRNNIRFHHVGRRQELPGFVLDQVDHTVAETRHHTGLNLCLALNYSSRAEITDAVRAIGEKMQRGEVSPADVTEAMVSDHLYTAGMPDPDLLIRTAGEMRVSNYLLWQISYAELVVTQTLWPDFSEADLQEAIVQYAGRSRRFGALDLTTMA
jgi:undecaprenyl diphosphate synthase